MKKPSGKVLVLGIDNRSSLTVIRSLGRRNLEVHIGWCTVDCEALYSKYISKIQYIPFTKDISWKDSLTSLMVREQYNIVIPCHDQTLIPLQLNRNYLEPFGMIYLLEDQVFDIVFDKFKANDLAYSLGIPLPRGKIISDISQVEAVLSEFKFPVILKPRSSFTIYNLENKYYVHKVYNPKELRTCLLSLFSQGNVLIQENFPGTGVGVEFIADHGEILLAFQHVRVHEPVTGGGSSYRKSVPIHAELIDATRRLIKSLNYTGVAMIEFKFNFETGKWIFVEINGRFWGSLPLAVAAGADFPYYLYQLIVEGRRSFPQDYKVGLFCRNLTNDLGSLPQNLKLYYADPSSKAFSKKKVAEELSNILLLRERSDTLVIDDPMPGLVELGRLIRKATLIIWIKILLSMLDILPFRAFYAKKASLAFSRAKNVLFVCKGNICRSPFAQYFLLSLVGNSKKVMSCGYFPQSGRPSPREAIKAAQEWGIELKGHRSVLLSKEFIDFSDIVIVFDEDNLKKIGRAHV